MKYLLLLLLTSCSQHNEIRSVLDKEIIKPYNITNIVSDTFYYADKPDVIELIKTDVTVMAGDSLSTYTIGRDLVGVLYVLE